ncbi:MAG: sulfatase-like hydrolase/transferase [Opitutae bacterium]|nr:sulfatase-like hydrolase/transferase [Opitutae bacterium]
MNNFPQNILRRIKEISRGFVAASRREFARFSPRRDSLPVLALVVLSIVAIILTRESIPHVLFREDLELVSATRFILLALSVVWFALFFALSRKIPLWGRGLLFFVFFLPSAFSAYLKINYGMELNYGFIMECYNTHVELVSSYFSPVAIFTFLVFVAAMFGVAFVVGKIPVQLPSSRAFVVGLIVVLAFSANQANLRTWIAPVKIALSVEKWARHYRTTDRRAFELLAELEDLPQEVTPMPAEISHVNSVPIVVLHIGESSRADHAPFNGYARDTMPHMFREYKAGNLISFPKCVSFSVDTVLSTRGVMSPSTVLDNAFRYPTFIPALDRSGVATCGFFSSYEINTGGKVGISLICKALQQRISTGEFAATLLPKVKETIAAQSKNPQQKQFYFYYGEGSHTPRTAYDFDRHSVFTPTAKYICKDERTVNNYDNTFIAVDEFCGGFIDELRDKNAVYIFVGDHGDGLGEEGLWGRIYRRKESRHVLFFIWASDKFKSENPELWATLAKNRERLGVVSHDYVYNSVLHLFGIKTPYYDKRADLFSDDAVPFPTEMPDAEDFGPIRYGDSGETAEVR